MMSNMTTDEKVSSLELIATILSDKKGTSEWVVTGDQLQLNLFAGDKKWSISAALHPREAAEDMCVSYLLRKLSHAAGVCPSCQSPVGRASNTKDNKTPVKNYRCASCMHSWTDS